MPPTPIRAHKREVSHGGTLLGRGRDPGRAPPLTRPSSSAILWPSSPVGPSPAAASCRWNIQTIATKPPPPGRLCCAGCWAGYCDRTSLAAPLGARHVLHRIGRKPQILVKLQPVEHPAVLGRIGMLVSRVYLQLEMKRRRGIIHAIPQNRKNRRPQPLRCGPSADPPPFLHYTGRFQTVPQLLFTILGIKKPPMRQAAIFY